MEDYYVMKEEKRENKLIIAMPSYLPQLFVSPSCLPEFTAIVESVAEMKAKLIQLNNKETTDKKEKERMEEECCWLRVEIYFLENEANVMRKELVERIYLEVKSVKEMMAVNDHLMMSVDEGMQCFSGKILLGGKLYLPKDAIKAITNTQRLLRKTF